MEKPDMNYAMDVCAYYPAVNWTVGFGIKIVRIKVFVQIHSFNIHKYFIHETHMLY